MAASEGPTELPAENVIGAIEEAFDAALRAEDDRGVVTALRAQAGETELWHALARFEGAELRVQRGEVRIEGTLRSSLPDHCVIDAGSVLHLVRPVAGTCFVLPRRGGNTVAETTPPRTPAPAGLAATAIARHGFLLALRDLSRRRRPVQVQLVDGLAVSGTVEVVGRDYFELAVHDLDEARRRPSVRGTWIVPFSAVAVVSEPMPAR